MASRVVLIDGIPGSGKTSMAQSLYDTLTASRVSSRWYVEEDAEHPVTPKAIRRQAHSASFPALCLARWRDFILRSAPDTVHVLEGVAFQSTVRFMYAADRPFDEIEAYFCRFVDVIDASHPLLVYLVQHDSSTYLTDFVYPLRGAAWVAKLSAYVAATPIGRRCRLTGVDGLTEFWTRYSELCHRLVRGSQIETLELTVEPGRHESTCTQAGRWVLERAGGSANSSPRSRRTP